MARFESISKGPRFREFHMLWPGHRQFDDVQTDRWSLVEDIFDHTSRREIEIHLYSSVISTFCWGQFFINSPCQLTIEKLEKTTLYM